MWSEDLSQTIGGPWQWNVGKAILVKTRDTAETVENPEERVLALGVLQARVTSQTYGSARRGQVGARYQ